jgi:hypothetical protein
LTTAQHFSAPQLVFDKKRDDVEKIGEIYIQHGTEPADIQTKILV